MTRAIILMSVVLLAGCAEGEYRIPYTNGAEIDVTYDFVTHAEPATTSYDMVAKSGPGLLRAAAPGWIRRIEDTNQGSGTGDNNYVWIEHPYPYCQDPDDPARSNWPGKPADYDRKCKPCNKQYCNEWSFYYHMAPDSVRGNGPFEAGLTEDDWVEAGRLIGIESDIGFAMGEHLHWHVAVIDPTWEPSENGDYEEPLSDSGRPRPELIPIVCTSFGDRVMFRFIDYTAVPCP